MSEHTTRHFSDPELAWKYIDNTNRVRDWENPLIGDQLVDDPLEARRLAYREERKRAFEEAGVKYDDLSAKFGGGVTDLLRKEKFNPIKYKEIGKNQLDKASEACRENRSKHPLEKNPVSTAIERRNTNQE